MIDFFNKNKVKIIGIPTIALLIPIIFKTDTFDGINENYWSGVFWSGLHAFLIWNGSDYVNAFCVKKYPRFEDTKKRIALSVLCITLLVILVVALVVGIIFFTSKPCTFEMILEDFKISYMVTSIVVSWQEANYLFSKWKETIVEAERLQKQTVVAQYETLKNQVNPHFLFNSLNTLAALIHKDPKKAEQFTEEFSKVYRYLLEMKDQTVVTLKHEMDFVNSYLFLQKKRYQENLVIEINISQDSMDLFLPPVSVQMLVENALKHNVISKGKPLTLTIYTKERRIYVVNDYVPRNEYTSESTGLGLHNLKEKYNIISEDSPSFNIEKDKYVAYLPLIISD